MSDSRQDKLPGNIFVVLDESADELDAGVQLRLDSIRQRALSRYAALSAENSFVPAVVAQLERSLRAIDPVVTQRLSQIRQQALNQQPKLSSWQAARQWFSDHRLAIPASAFATVCVMVTATMLLSQRPGTGIPAGMEEDLVLFASAGEMELYENLDFYLWLTENGSLN